MTEPVGLIGIGLVGSALARHFLDSGIEVIGFDIDPERNAGLEALGGTVASSPRQVAEHCRRVVLALMSPEIVDEVLNGEQGLLRAETPPRFVIDVSTGIPEAARRFADDLTALGGSYIEAPISGSSRQIASRQAVVLAAGDAEAVEACRDLLDVIADRTIMVGPVGNGAAAKLATNLVLGLNRLALAEGLVFAEAAGLDGRLFMDLVRDTPAYSRAVDAKGEKLVNRDYSTQSKVSQHLKDLSQIRAIAEQAGQPLPLAAVHAELLDRLVAEGQGDLDTCAVIEAVRNMPGSRGPISLHGESHD
jgi:3-hydroxyisobutyrate dehydrogenase-like beta-hydroxyacid dehydrogenase